jgi:hypothetical protein
MSNFIVLEPELIIFNTKNLLKINSDFTGYQLHFIFDNNIGNFTVSYKDTTVMETAFNLYSKLLTN